MPLALETLQQLAGETLYPPLRPVEAAPDSTDLRAYPETIRGHDAAGLRAALTRALARLGVGRFVIEVVGPLNAAVGDAWVRGQMEIYEEHVYTETVHAVLRHAIAGVPAPAADGSPCVLLSTSPASRTAWGC